MKKSEWNRMTEQERSAFISTAINKRIERMGNEANTKLAAKAKEKLARGERLTIPEFEAYTGVMFHHNMTGKMEGVLGLGSNVLMNKYCECRQKCPGLVCAACYADSQQLMYSGVFENTAYNTAELTTEILPDEVIPVIEDDILRIEPFGDTNNETQSINYIKIALFNVDVDTTIWTKNPEFYHRALKSLGITELPKNLHFILSSDKLNEEKQIPPRYQWFIKKTFTVYTLNWLLENGLDWTFINCGGRSCKKCQRCYKRFNCTGASVRELLKADHARAKKLGWDIA